MGKKLNASARDTLRNAGVTSKQRAVIQVKPDGKWYGDACGCNDDRCGCLPALLELYFWPPSVQTRAGRIELGSEDFGL